MIDIKDLKTKLELKLHSSIQNNVPIGEISLLRTIIYDINDIIKPNSCLCDKGPYPMPDNTGQMRCINCGLPV